MDEKAKIKRLEGALKLAIKQRNEAESACVYLARSLREGPPRTKRQRQACRRFDGSALFYRLELKYGDVDVYLELPNP